MQFKVVLFTRYFRLQKRFITNCTFYTFCLSIYRTRTFYRRNHHFRVTKRCNLIARIRITASAGIFCITDFRTRRFGDFIYIIMPGRRYHFLCNQTCITNRTVLSICQACFRTRCRISCINHFRMAKCIHRNGFAADFRITYHTIYNVVIAAIVCTIRSNVVFYKHFAFRMPKRIYRNHFTAQFFPTNRTVYNVVIATLVCTIRSNVVFRNNFAFHMPKRRYFFIGRIRTSRTGFVCIPTDFRTRCYLRHMAYSIVSKHRNFFCMRMSVIILTNISNYALFLTSRIACKRIVLMADRPYILVHITISTTGTGMRSIPFCFTSRLCHCRYVLVTLCRH